MKRTMIYLPEQQHELLKRKAARERRSMAELIRECLERQLESEAAGDPMAFVGIGEGPVKGDASEKVDEYLRELLR